MTQKAKTQESEITVETGFTTVVDSGTAVLDAYEVRQPDGRWLIVKGRHPQAVKRDRKGHLRRPRFNDVGYPMLTDQRPPERWEAIPAEALEVAVRSGAIAYALQRAREGELAARGVAERG